MDFEDPNIFDRMAAAVIQYAPLLQNSLVSLVIDEGQDFEDAWVQALLAMAGPDTRVFVLEDVAQKLYSRTALLLSSSKSPLNTVDSCCITVVTLRLCCLSLAMRANRASILSLKGASASPTTP